MRVLVTGGCGFLGSHVCEYYAGHGHQVVSLDNLTKFELLRTGYNTEAARRHNWEVLAALGVNLVQEDVRHLEAVLDLASGCDFLVHTAAQPAMTISWEEPLLDCTTNVLGTLYVLEAARRHRIPVASCATIHVYGNLINDTLKEGDTRYLREPAAIAEDHPTLEGRLSPLHASKMAGDIYVRAYIDTYRVQAASLRLTGIYGPRQLGGEDHGWVANFSIRALLGLPITIYGSGKQVRDILYVTDAARAFQAFYENPAPGVYNIGGGPHCSLSLLECLDLIRELTGRDVEVNFAPDRYGDLRYFVCDLSRASSLLRWQPRVRPREGIGQLLTWIEENRHLFHPG